MDGEVETELSILSVLPKCFLQKLSSVFVCTGLIPGHLFCYFSLKALLLFISTGLKKLNSYKRHMPPH